MNTFSGILSKGGSEVGYRGRYIPLDEWQAMKRQEAKRDRLLRITTLIICALAFCWIVVPGLWNIWRG